MCFLIPKDDAATFKVAETDLLVYKAVDNINDNCCQSIYAKNFIYHKGIINPVEKLKPIKLSLITDVYFVDRIHKDLMASLYGDGHDDSTAKWCIQNNILVYQRGYHSFEDIIRAKMHADTIAEFIIPAGTNYLKFDSMIISETIIFKDMIFKDLSTL